MKDLTPAETERNEVAKSHPNTLASLPTMANVQKEIEWHERELSMLRSIRRMLVKREDAAGEQ